MNINKLTIFGVDFHLDENAQYIVHHYLFVNSDWNSAYVKIDKNFNCVYYAFESITRCVLINKFFIKKDIEICIENDFIHKNDFPMIFLQNIIKHKKAIILK